MSHKLVEEQTGPFGTTVDMDLDQHDRRDPVTKNAVWIYRIVQRRMEHILDLCEGKAYRNQTYQRDSAELVGDKIYAKYSYSHCGSCGTESADETFPAAYLMMPDYEIVGLELELRRQTDEAEQQKKEKEKTQHLATKRNELERLKKELGEV